MIDATWIAASGAGAARTRQLAHPDEIVGSII